VSDERDNTIDRLLRRGAATSALRPADDCLDGETLAAWADRMLSLAESARIEGHLADCTRCQEMAALFASATPPTPLALPRLHVLPTLKWLVPLATAVVVVAVWGSLPDPQRNAAQPSVAAVPAEAQRSEPPREVQPGPATPAPSRGVAGSRAAAPSPAKPSPDLVARESRALIDQPSDKREVKAVAAAPAPRAEAPPPERIVPETAAGAAVTAPSSPLPPRPAAQAPLADSVLRTPSGMRLGQPVDILTPDPRIRWRITDSTVLQRSATAGAQWQTVAFTAEGPLYAGHAPAANVMWLVGAGGLIYITADGATFTRVRLPDAADLVSVTATNDRQAVVRSSDGRAWRTPDGGNTWTRD
jgi:hypothetical protein